MASESLKLDGIHWSQYTRIEFKPYGEEVDFASGLHLAATAVQELVSLQTGEENQDA